MSESVEYFNQCLWQYNDKQVSNSFLTFEKFSVVDEKYGPCPLKLKMSISPFKGGNGNYIYMIHQDVYLVLQKVKAKKDEFGKIVNDINVDAKKQVNITSKLTKKKIIITFLNRVEYGGCCVRIILSDKDKDYLDSEKVYIPVYDFMSLLNVLGEYRDRYISASDNMYTAILTKQLHNEIKALNDKASSYYSEAVQLFKGRSLLMQQQAMMNKTFTASSEPFKPEELPTKNMSPTVMDEDHDIFGNSDPVKPEEPEDDLPYDFEPKETHPAVQSVIENSERKDPVIIEEESDVNDLQSDMDSFIKVEAPKVDLGLIDNEERHKPDTSEALVSSGEFTEQVLKNNLLNLEILTTNLVNDDLPFSKLCDHIKAKMGFNPLEKINQSDINSVNYLISNDLKVNLKKCLEEKIDFPSNVSPILFSDVKLPEPAISLMYDLFIYFIYYTQLRNMLKEKDYNPINNRDFMCYSFKTIASPLAITGFNQIDESTMLNEISNRYRKYRVNGVFNKIRTEISEKYSCEFDLPEDALQNEASRIYKAIKANYDKLTVEYAFKKFVGLNLKLGYNDFKENSFQDEQIKKIIAIEFNFRKNGSVKYDKIDHQKFDDIPSSVLAKYDIKEQKYDSTNLKRYIKELTKDNDTLQKISLDIANKINYSYRDLKNVKIDLTQLPVEILRSIFMWDIDRDQKITINYLHYREVVQKCSLTKDMIISLLTNIQDTIDVDFVNSFIAVRDE